MTASSCGERRAQIDVLLTRYARHAPAEAEHLRALIEAERCANAAEQSSPRRDEPCTTP